MVSPELPVAEASLCVICGQFFFCLRIDHGPQEERPDASATGSSGDTIPNCKNRLVEHQLVVQLGGLQAMMVRAPMVRLGQSKE